VAHFILENLKDGSLTLGNNFFQDILCLHEVIENIISNRDTQMTSKFWKTLNATLGTKLNFNSEYHPQTDG
jgi:hypothetical protein